MRKMNIFLAHILAKLAELAQLGFCLERLSDKVWPRLSIFLDGIEVKLCLVTAATILRPIELSSSLFFIDWQGNIEFIVTSNHLSVFEGPKSLLASKCESKPFKALTWCHAR